MVDSGSELSVVELLVVIARALVDNPDSVSVTAKAGEESTNLQLLADPTDVGKIIGKQGRTARSLRTLLGAISVKVGHRYYLEILEERGQDTEEQ